MAKRNRNISEARARSREVGRELADRVNEQRAKRGLGPDPRLEIALTKTRDEMTPDERRVDGEWRRDETTRMLEERIAYHGARRSGSK